MSLWHSLCLGFVPWSFLLVQKNSKLGQPEAQMSGVLLSETCTKWHPIRLICKLKGHAVPGFCQPFASEAAQPGICQHIMLLVLPGALQQRLAHADCHSVLPLSPQQLGLLHPPCKLGLSTTCTSSLLNILLSAATQQGVHRPQAGRLLYKHL